MKTANEIENLIEEQAYELTKKHKVPKAVYLGKTEYKLLIKSIPINDNNRNVPVKYFYTQSGLIDIVKSDENSMCRVIGD